MKLLFLLIVVFGVLNVIFDVDAFTFHSSRFLKYKSQKNTLHFVTIIQSNVVKTRIYQMALKASASMPKIGDAVFAKVEDISGSVTNPMVEFSIEHDGEKMKAFMATKALSANEKLALQVGVVLKVYVSTIHDNNVEVALKSTKEYGYSIPSIDYSSYIQKTKIERTDDTRSDTRKVDKKAFSNSLPPNGIFLNDLKTGIKINGKVVSSTAYAAFVDCNVYRNGKNGTFAQVNAMIHKSDLSRELFSSKSNSGLLDRGLKVSLYVKEVFKNSGRFTLTSDSGVNKEHIINEKSQVKEEGKERRKSRRLRKQLEDLNVGLTVQGSIKDITSEGILVSFTSLGPIEFLGLIPKSTLPKQYAVPPDLRDDFQKQLLGQDFRINREISCSIAKILPTSSTSPYLLKLEFEDFVSQLNDEVDDITLPADLELLSDDDVDDDEDELEIGNEVDISDSNEDNLEYSNDVREIFDELRGNQPLLAIQNIYDWADIQDMISEQTIKKSFLDKIIAIVDSNKNSFLNFEQFDRVIRLLQDVIELSDEEEIIEYLGNQKFSQVTMSSDSSKSKGDLSSSKQSDKKESNNNISKNNNNDDGNNGDDGNDSDDYIDDDDYSRQIFDKLRGKSNQLALTSLMKWDELIEMIETDVIDGRKIKELYSQVVSNEKQGLTFEEFTDFLVVLDETCGGDEEEDMSPEDLERNRREIFEALSDGKTTISVKTFLAWDEIMDLQRDGVIDDSNIDDSLKSLGLTRNGNLTFNQFCTLIDTIDESLDSNEVETEVIADNVKSVESESTNEEDDEEEVISDEEMAQMRLELYDSLRGNKPMVSVKAFMNWDELVEMKNEGVITNDDINSYLVSAGLSKNSNISFEKFNELIDIIDEATADTETTIDLDEENNEVELSEDMLNEMRLDIFNDLKGKNSKLTVKDFLTWEDLKEMKEQEIITSNDVDESLKSLGLINKSSEISFEVFCKLIDLIDGVSVEDSSMNVEVNDNEESDLPLSSSSSTSKMPLESIQQFYDELKGKSKVLKLKSLLDSSYIQNLIKDEVFSLSTFEVFAKEICGSSNPTQPLDFNHFNELISLVENTRVGDYESEIVREFESLSDSELESIQQEIFDELKSPKTNTISLESFLKWESVVISLEANDFSENDVMNAIKKVVGKNNITKGMNYQQFCEVVAALDSSQDEMIEESKASTKSDSKPVSVSKKDKDDIVVNEDEDEEDLETIQLAIFDELKSPKSKLVTMESLLAWDSIASAIKDDDLSVDEVKDAVKQVIGTKSSKGLNYQQFSQVLSILDGEDDVEDETTVEEEDDDALENLSPEELDNIRTEIFNELKTSKTNLVTIKNFMAWDSIKEAIETEEMTKQDVLEALKIANVNANSKGMTYQQFCKVVSVLDGSDEEDEEQEGEEEEEEEITSGKGFGSPTSKATKQQSSPNSKEAMVDELSKEIFDELRGKRRTVNVDTFKEWEDVKSLLDKGGLKHSTLERAIVKVGSYDTGELTFQQFQDLLDIIQKSADFSVIDTDELEDEESQEEESDEEVVLDIYNELKGTKRDSITVSDFIQWEDVQDLLTSKALTKDDLAKALQDCGIKGENSKLSFKQFSELLQLIDNVIDKEKIQEFDNDSDSDNVNSIVVNADAGRDDDDDDDDDDDEVILEDISSKKAKLAIDKNDKVVDEDDDIFEFDENYDDEEEIKEMFEDLAKGKETISEKQLRKWEDLQEMIDNEIISKATVDGYIKMLNIKNGQVGFEAFRKFIKLLDTVLIDEKGEFVELEDKSRAVNLDDLLENE